MFKSFTGIALFCLFGGIGYSATAWAGPIVWSAPSLSRIGINDSAGSSKAVHIYAAKGEVESFQIGIQGPAGGLTGVKVGVSNLGGPGGVIYSTAATLYAEHYVHVTQNSPNWGGSNQPIALGPTNGYFADALIPFNDPATGKALSGAKYQAIPFNVGGGYNQTIWVDVTVPPGTAAGDYTGVYTVSSDQGGDSGPITLTVWNFDYPFAPSEKSVFLVSSDNSLATQEMLLKNLVQPSTVDPSNQSMLMNYYGLNLAGLSFSSGSYAGNCNMTPAPSVAQFQAAAAAAAPSLLVYDYSADEIGACPNLYPNVIQWAQNMHKAGVKNVVTMPPTLALFDDGLGKGQSAVDIWVEMGMSYDGSMNAAAMAKGDQVWSYTAVVQDPYSPKWEIDFAPINFRIQPGFLNAYLGLSGILYWKIDGWLSSDPWNDVNNTGIYSAGNYPGEGMIVYPGGQVGVTGSVPSMRLKWIRDGIKDYEYVQLLKKAGQGSWAQAQAKTVAPDWVNWTRDPNALMSVRQAMGQMLSNMKNGFVSAVSASPSSGSGIAQTFQFTFSDTAGASDISGGHVLINGYNGAPYGCWVYFNAATNQVSLASDNTSSWAGPLTLGSGGSVTNSQCTISGAGGSITRNGANLVLTLPITFTTAFSGPKGIYIDATSYEGISASNFVGSWTVRPQTAAVTGATVVPSSGSGLSQTFQFTFSDPVGAWDVSGGHVLINAYNGPTNGCWLYFNTATNQVSLASDNSLSWVGPMTLGSGSISNSHCTIGGEGASITSSGTNLVLTLPIAFSPSFAGPNGIYVDASSYTGANLANTPVGAWTVAPTSGMAATPSAGTGWGQLFTVNFVDNAGYADIQGAHVLIGPSSVNKASSCWVYIDRVANTIALANDSGGAWGLAKLGSSTPLSNNQCSVSAAASSFSGSGNVGTVTIWASFALPFAGYQTIFGNWISNEGVSTPYTALGTWNP